MPTIHRIQSIKIDVYGGEHPPPHFHAIYAEHEILVDIATCTVLQGFFPPKELHKVLEWASRDGVQRILLLNFERLNPRLKK